ncbi:MAG: biopolymer transporter ExbD [Pseudomonadota bacterium]
MRTADRGGNLRRPLPLTPLIDVVFLLLLFFMLASVFQKEGEIEITAAGNASSTPSTSRPVFIRLHGDGRFDVNGQEIEGKKLGEAVALLTAGTEQLAGAVIQIREGAKTKHVVDGLVSLRRAGVQPVAMVK